MSSSTPSYTVQPPTSTAWPSGGLIRPSVFYSNSGSAYVTTASYATAISGPLVVPRTYNSLTVNVKEYNSGSILYQILGYTESTGFIRPITLATAIPVSKNAADYQVVIAGLTAVDVQAVDAVGGTHGVVVIDIVLN